MTATQPPESIGIGQLFVGGHQPSLGARRPWLELSAAHTTDGAPLKLEVASVSYRSDAYSGERERDAPLDIDRKILQAMSGEDRQHSLVSDHRDPGPNVVE